MVSKRTAKKKTNESIKQEMLNSLQKNDNAEEKGINETADNVNNYQEAIQIINHSEEIIKAIN